MRRLPSNPALGLVAIAAACGGSPSPTPVPSGPAASIVAPRATEADVVVAEVNGRPVWGSCVSEQVTVGAADRKAALDQCIDFELLAQAAEQRGLASDADVILTTRTALVSELVAAEFEARYQKPSDLGATLDAVLAKNAWRMHRPELRSSTYVRALVPPNAAPEIEAAAKQIAEKVVAELAGEPGLMPSHLKEAMDRHTKGTSIQVETEDLAQVPATARFEAKYLEGLFGIPEVGRISAPVRTSRGWDVILWSGGLPPYETTRDKLALDVFPELRRAQFSLWIGQLIKAGGIKIEIDQATLARLDEVTP